MDAIGIANTVLLLGAVLVIAGILSSLIATRFGAPMLLVFLGLGMLAGEDGPGGIQFSDYELTYLAGSLALAIILFDGGLRTRLASFRAALAPAAMLATAGVLITAILTGAAAVLVLGLAPLEGFLIGAIVASTDAAAVFFLLRTGGLQLKSRVGATLEIESGTNDPVAVFLTVATVELIGAGAGLPDGAVLLTLVREAVLGAALGVAGGFGVTWLLNRVELPTGLHPLLVVAAAVAIFGLAATTGGSAFLAVYLAGLVVGNRPVRAFASITSLHDAATWLAQIVMFLILGLLVTPHNLVGHALPALAVALFLIFVARPAMVFLCLWPFRFDLREKLFIAWVGLRGAVSIFLSAIPVLTGMPGGQIYFEVAFFVVLVSLVVQGWTIKPAARRLGQSLPRVALPVTRVELDLPGQLGMELVGYPIGEDSRVLQLTTLPDWVRLVLVVRGGEVLEPVAAGALAAGDYAYFLAPPLKAHRLDRLFASTAERHPLSSFDGEFAIRGDAPVARLDELYDLGADAEARAVTVAELFAIRFDTTPDVGDSLALGRGVLTVRALDGETVVRAGLTFEEPPPPVRAFIERVAAVPQRTHELFRRLVEIRRRR